MSLQKYEYLTVENKYTLYTYLYMFLWDTLISYFCKVQNILCCF